MKESKFIRILELLLLSSECLSSKISKYIFDTCKAVTTVQTIDICADIGRQNANASQN